MDFGYEIWKEKLTPAIGKAVKEALPAMATVMVKHNDPAEPAPCVARIARPEPDAQIGVRIREWKFYESHGDVTFRADRGSAWEQSEVEHIIAGWGRYYLYGWATDDGDLNAWTMLDLDVLREKNLLTENRKLSHRPDGAEFVSVPVTELFLRGCIIASKLPDRDLGAKSREPRSDQ